MACSIAAGRAAASGCGTATKAGLNELNAWLVNRADITYGAVSSSTGVSATFTMGGAAVVYPYAFDSRGFQFDETMTTDQNTGAITHKPVVTGRFIGLSGKNRADVELLKNTNLCMIVEAKSGLFLVFGATAGLTLDTNTAGSTAENLGEILTLSTSEANPESEKYFQLLATDAATTLALIVAAE